MIEHGLMGWGKCEQGFRRMAARNKPAGIRSLVYGIGKGKAGIEGLKFGSVAYLVRSVMKSLIARNFDHDRIYVIRIT